MTMLIRKQLCLAENHLGMQCHCQALSSGRCRFHGPLSARTSLRQRLSPRLSGGFGELFASFAVWRELFAPAHPRGLRQTPVAFNL